jgi:hypothetical protein
MAKRTDRQREVDSTLTKYLQSHESMKKLMLHAMVEIAKRVATFERDHLFFHVKGSSALGLFFEHHGHGGHGIPQSDWDTQIVINPFLQPAEWYAGFRKLAEFLRDTLLDIQDVFSKGVPAPFLQAVAVETMKELGPGKLGMIQTPIAPVAKQPCNELVLSSLLLHPLQYLDNAQGVLKRYPEAEWDTRLEEYYPFGSSPFEPRNKDPLATIQMNYTIDKFYLFRLMVNFSCKPPIGGNDDEYKFHAELIDISIPRRDTVEALQQWRHTRPRVFPSAAHGLGIPVPNHFYQLEEQILMVRENVAGTSTSKDKVKKRLVRGVLIAKAMARMDGVVELKKKMASLFPMCGSAVAGDAFFHTIIAVVLDHFAEAYALTFDPGLCDRIGKTFVAMSGHLGSPGSEEDAFFALMTMVQALSKRIEDHLQARSDIVIKKNWPAVQQFLMAMFTGITVLTNKVLEQSAVVTEKQPVRFAVAGDLAALAHLTEAGRHGVSCPVQCIPMKVYVATPLNPDPAKAIVGEVVKRFNEQSTTLRFEAKPTEKKLFLFWPEPIAFEGEEPYPFLMATIEVVSCDEAELPTISMVAGIPFLSPRSLLKEYDEELAHLEEFGVVQRKQAISAALKKIVTQFW